MTKNCVVIGAGQAAAQFCETLRAKGYDGAITVIGDEPWPPYQRPPLSKAYLQGDFDRARLFLRPESFYRDNRIDLRLGVAAVAIDRAAKRVRLADGSALPYDSLALTTGARARRLDCPGANLSGVHYIRSIDDIDRLEPQIAAARKAVVIGGGYVGLEAAAALRKKGLEVTLAHRSARLLSRVASAQSAAFFKRIHEEAGVHVRLNQTIAAIDGAGRVQHVELERLAVDHVARPHRATIEADLVIAGVGALPNLRLAAEAGLATQGGVVVDAACRSSDPAIVAAGDCATFPTKRYGRIRLESVQNAIDQAKAAAASVAGEAVEYEPSPWFWSDQYDIKFQSAGLPQGHDRAVWRPGRDARAGSVWLYDGGRLICVEAMNDPRAYMLGKRWIEQGRSPAPEAVQAADDLKALS